MIRDIEVPKEEGVTVTKIGKTVDENMMPSKSSVTEKEALDFLKVEGASLMSWDSWTKCLREYPFLICF